MCNLVRFRMILAPMLLLLAGGELPGQEKKAARWSFAGSQFVGFSADSKVMILRVFPYDQYAPKKFDLSQLGLSGGPAHDYFLWDVPNRQFVSRLPVHNRRSDGVLPFVAYASTLSPDGKLLVSAANRPFVAQNRERGEVKVWDLANTKDKATLEFEDLIPKQIVFNGQWVTLGGLATKKGTPTTFDGALLWWNPETGKQKLIKTHGEMLSSLAFSPDGKYLASAGWDEKVRLWDAATQEELTVLEAPARDEVSRKFYTLTVLSVAFSPDGSVLATAHQDRAIRLWDVASKKLLDTLYHADSRWVGKLAFHPSGKYLVAADDHHLAVWDLKTKKMARHTTLSPMSSSLTFSPDGQLIAYDDWVGALVVRPFPLR